MELIRPDRKSKCTWTPNATNSPHTNRSQLNNRMTVLPDILHVIGQTPLIRLNTIPKKHGVKCEILVKCEFVNPGGSVKDRIGYRMIQDAEEKGILKPGCTIIEPTSGNTGIGLAMAAAVKGYKCIIVMPEKMSNEKVYTLNALGAEIVRTPTEAAYDSPDGHIATSQKLAKEIPNSVILDQYTNPGNPLAHYDQTAEEIWKQCDGKVDYVVIGAGTGGTIAGVGRKFKELCPTIKVIGVDPEGSILARTANKEDAVVNFYEVEGIGYDFMPTVLDTSVIDSWIETNDYNSFNTARSLIRDEGLLCGGSSGANVYAALQIAKDLPADKRVVVILPDSIRNYMTKFVSDHWMEAREFMNPPEPIEKNKWWWNLPVSAMHFEKYSSISTNTICGDALTAIQNKKCQYLPVSNESNHIKGFVELNHILNELISGRVTNTDPVDKIMNKTFRKVYVTTTLGRVSRILEVCNYVVVIGQDHEHCGVLTPSNLFSFINSKSNENSANGKTMICT